MRLRPYRPKTKVQWSFTTNSLKSIHFIAIPCKVKDNFLARSSILGVGRGPLRSAYCQNNEISWFDWRLLKKHGDIHRFVKHLIAYRLNRDLSLDEHHLTLNQLLAHQKIDWHGVRLGQPDWSHDSHSLAFTVPSLKGRFLFHVMLNAYWEALEFELPPPAKGPDSRWRRLLDTFLDPPYDICAVEKAPAVSTLTYLVQPRSVVLLFSSVL